MLVNMRIDERWCKRDLIVDLPLMPDEEDVLKNMLAGNTPFTWPSARLTLLTRPVEE